MISRRQAIAGGAAAAVTLMIQPLPATLIASTAPTPRMWKLKFAAEIARHIDFSVEPDFLEAMVWITNEADYAFDCIENAITSDPIKEAKEWAYAAKVSQ
jgi:hypothetical protein